MHYFSIENEDDIRAQKKLDRLVPTYCYSEHLWFERQDSRYRANRISKKSEVKQTTIKPAEPLLHRRAW
ncbi:MAG: hypothetical protein RI902_494 [Pseudomonadota bacterium]|jgi:hypothetical protein